MQALASALHAAAKRRHVAFRKAALAALDKVVSASDQDLFGLVSELLLSGCLAAGKPSKPAVGPGSCLLALLWPVAWGSASIRYHLVLTWQASCLKRVISFTMAAGRQSCAPLHPPSL